MISCGLEWSYGRVTVDMYGSELSPVSWFLWVGVVLWAWGGLMGSRRSYGAPAGLMRLELSYG